jgi:hypothetical protein
MFLANNLNKGGSLGGYQISRSLRFNSADSAYLNRTPASAGNRKTWTWSGWVKRSQLGVYQRILEAGSSTADRTVIGFDNADKLEFFNIIGGSVDILTTTQVFRDVSAWYHIVVAMDTTQATASNRTKIYLNGIQITSFTTANYESQNTDTFVNSTIIHRIGAAQANGDLLNGYMTEVNFIDGTQLTPSSFGETNAQTGVWQPKAYSGSYGTNGFYLNFSDNSNTTAATLGKDYSGNGNNWTPNNFSVTAGAGNDSLVDSPTSYGTDTGVGGTVRGNYATLNPLVGLTGTRAFTNGNLDVSVTTDNVNTFATIAVPSSGKWYWEYQITTITVAPMGGVITGNESALSSPSVVYRTNGNKIVDNVQTSYGATYTTTDVIGVAADVDGGTITFYKNGTSQGAITYATGGLFPAVRSNAQPDAFTMNFGQRAFANTAPSGFKALCTQNLPTPTIGATTATLAGKYFNPVLYTGNGTSTQTITGVGFQPDWVWTKSRSNTSNHSLVDSVRGGTKVLISELTDSEYTGTWINSFNSDGYVLGSNSTNSNASGYTYVAWNWKANGSGSTNTAGSITSTVSANTTSGFSVVTYTGTGSNATVGHGLGSVPKMMIVKGRSTAYNWRVYHVSTGNDGCLFLNTTAAYSSNSAIWNTTTPTSTVFSIGTDVGVNESASTNVAYVFAEVAGYSKFGSYTGNGSGDGPFIYCGFRPAYVMIKCSSASGTSSNWIVQDTTRDTYNAMPDILIPNLSNAELTDATASTGYLIDCLSNGFKIRTNNSNWNANGSTYIFMAFATSPFKYSLAR